MMDRQRLFTQLKLHEGVEQKAYLCSAGYITIGVGRNLEDRGLSDAEIEFLLDNDVIIVENELDQSVPMVERHVRNPSTCAGRHGL
jgi:lysozyme